MAVKEEHKVYIQPKDREWHREVLPSGKVLRFTRDSTKPINNREDFEAEIKSPSSDKLVETYFDPINSMFIVVREIS